MSNMFFSPLGKLGGRAIYFACVNFFFFLNWPNISQHLLGRFSRSFLPHERYLHEFSWSGPLLLIPQGTLPWQQIFGNICEITFIQHTGISKRIWLSQFWFKNIQWRYVVYMLCKFDQDRFSNPREIANCAMIWRSSFICHLARVYFKRGFQPKCGVQDEKCGVQNWKMCSPKQHLYT